MLVCSNLKENSIYSISADLLICHCILFYVKNKLVHTFVVNLCFSINLLKFTNDIDFSVDKRNSTGDADVSRERERERKREKETC